jgi:ribosomal protein S18 acetylase RimI-like enzyme
MNITCHPDDGPVTAAHCNDLTDVLLDCVQGGASVSFLWPLPRERAAAFWERAADETGARRRILLLAHDAQGVCGTVQLILDLPDNQPHRADLAKMLVHRRARHQGVGTALLRAAEAAALRQRRTLLVLDTVTDSPAYRLYERLGWQRVGEIPGYALWPDGRPCPTTYFYRQLPG